jgi:microcystin-dependent protein
MTISISGTTLTFNDATTQTTAAVNPIPAGSVMLFYQAAAPTGWTQVTTLNDYDLRLVSGTGGGTGGTTAYSTVFTNQTPTISGSFSVGSTTLGTGEIPSHNHGVLGNRDFAPCCAPTAVTIASRYSSSSVTSASTGGGGSHTHSISGSPTSSAITLNVRYANIIICSKN